MKKLSVDKKNYRKHERITMNRSRRRAQKLLEKFAFPKLITDEYMREYYGEPVFSVMSNGRVEHWYKNTKSRKIGSSTKLSLLTQQNPI